METNSESKTNTNIVFNSQMSQSNLYNSALNSSMKTTHQKNSNNFSLLQTPRNIYNNYINEEKNISERNQNEETPRKITEEELNEVLHEYKPLNDDIEVQKLPPKIMEDGGYYFGEWTLDGKNRHGRGIYIYDNDAKYIGQWANDKPNGQGKYIQDNTNYYEGTFYDGKFNGHGKLVENGSIYEGDFKEDKQEGIGKEKWPDGAVYEGEYKNGVKCGNGKFRWDNGTTYEGQFDNNKING